MKRHAVAPAGDGGQPAGEAGKDLPHEDQWEAGLRMSLRTLNTKKVTRANDPDEVLLVCLRHNLRKDNHDHRHRNPIDASRTVNNTVLLGADEPDAVAAAVASTLNELGLKTSRKDAIVGIELVFQPPPGHDLPAFYEECLAWARTRYQHLISAVVHRDQKRPHMHLLVLAVLDGRLAGSSLTNHGNRLFAQRAGFNAHMRRTMGIRVDRKPRRSMASIFTSPGKGAKTHEEAARRDAQLSRKPIQQPKNPAAPPPQQPDRSLPASTSNLMAHEPHGPDDLMCTTSSLRTLGERLLQAADRLGRHVEAAWRLAAPPHRQHSANDARFTSSLHAPTATVE